VIGQSVYPADSAEVREALKPFGVDTRGVSGQIGLHCSVGGSTW